MDKFLWLSSQFYNKHQMTIIRIFMIIIISGVINYKGAPGIN